MVYLMLIFLFRQLNELSILIENWLNWCYVWWKYWDDEIYCILIEYNMKCLWNDIAVLCDAWLILAFICLLSRQLTPWHFFPRFEQIADKAKSTCISIEVIRLGQWIICILLHFGVCIWGNWLPYNVLYMCCILMVYEWYM